MAAIAETNVGSNSSYDAINIPNVYLRGEVDTISQSGTTITISFRLWLVKPSGSSGSNWSYNDWFIGYGGQDYHVFNGSRTSHTTPGVDYSTPTLYATTTAGTSTLTISVGVSGQTQNNVPRYVYVNVNITGITSVGSPSVSISGLSSSSTTISASCTGSAGSGASSVSYTWYLNGGSAKSGSSVSWSGLNPNTSYSVSVTATNNVGLTASTSRTVATGVPSRPTYSTSFTNVTSTSARLVINVTSNPDSWWAVHYYETYGNWKGATTRGATGTFNVDYTGLAHNTQYNMATQYGGPNDTYLQGKQNHYVTTSGDAPTITSHGVQTYGQTTMVMRYTATYDTNSSLSSYRWDYTTGTLPSGPTDPTALNTNTISGLTPNTTYNYRLVVIEDVAGRASSVTGTFKTDYATQQITSIVEGDITETSLSVVVNVPNPSWLNSLTCWLYESDGTTLIATRNVTSGITAANSFLFEDLDPGTEYIIKAQINTYSQTASVGGYDSDIEQLSVTTLDASPVSVIQSDGTITKHKAYVMGKGDIYNPRRMTWQNGYYATGSVGDDIATLLTQSTSSAGGSACTVGYITILPAIEYTITNNDEVDFIIHGTDSSGIVTSAGYTLSPGSSYSYTGSASTTRLYISIESDVNPMINYATAPYFKLNIYRTVQMTLIPKENFVYINGKIRYIDIVQAGNSANTNTHINGLQVFDEAGNNIALNKPVSLIKGENATNLDIITDGNVELEKYATIEPESNNDLQTIVRVDLGQEYTNIQYAKVWRYWSDGRSYLQTGLYGRDATTKLTWKFQSYKHEGEYVETADGYVGQVYYHEINSFPLITSIVLDPPNTQASLDGTKMTVGAEWITYIPPVLDSYVSYRTDAILAANQGRLLKNDIGDLSELITDDKQNLVDAINEIYTDYVGESGYTNVLDALLDAPFTV